MGSNLWKTNYIQKLKKNKKHVNRRYYNGFFCRWFICQYSIVLKNVKMSKCQAEPAKFHKYYFSRDGGSEKEKSQGLEQYRDISTLPVISDNTWLRNTSSINIKQTKTTTSVTSSQYYTTRFPDHNAKTSVQVLTSIFVASLKI